MIRSSCAKVFSPSVWATRPNAFRSFVAAACSSNLASPPPYRVLLFGSDDFSCATLRSLYHARKGLVDEICAVVPPSLKVGRHHRQVETRPLRTLAEELGVPVEVLPATGLKRWEPPSRFRTKSSSNILVAASFGHLIPSSLLDMFEPLNALNVHPSLLPKYRGAAPIQWAIINGDEETGVSVQALSRGKFDRGRLLAQKNVTIPESPTFETLEPLLADIGGGLLVEVLESLPSAQAAAKPQDSTLATLAPKLTKEVARLDWSSQSAVQMDRLHRGASHQIKSTPWTTLPSSNEGSSVSLQIHLALPTVKLPEGYLSLEPGAVFLDEHRKTLLVRCAGSEVAEGVIQIDQVKPANGKWMKGRDWWNGHSKVKNLKFV